MWKYAIFERDGGITRLANPVETREQAQQLFARSLAISRMYGDINDIVMTDVYERDERDGVEMVYTIHVVLDLDREYIFEYPTYDDALAHYLKYRDFAIDPDKYSIDDGGDLVFISEHIAGIYMTRRVK